MAKMDVPTQNDTKADFEALAHGNAGTDGAVCVFMPPLLPELRRPQRSAGAAERVGTGRLINSEGRASLLGTRRGLPRFEGWTNAAARVRAACPRSWRRGSRRFFRRGGAATGRTMGSETGAVSEKKGAEIIIGGDRN